MWLLDYLIGAWQAVYDWFSSSYWYFKGLLDDIPNLLSELRQTITDYYYLALNSVNAAISSFYKATILPVLDYVYGLANDALDTARGTLDYVSTLSVDVGSIIDAVKNAIIDYLHSAYDNIITGARNLVDWVVNEQLPILFGYINALLPFQAWIAQAASILNINKIRDWLIMLESWKTTLVIFIDNPLGFILGMFWQVALEFLSYVIGYALGATKYTLPPVPSWRYKK